MKLSQNQQNVASAMDRYHHRCYLTDDYVAKMLDMTAGRVRSTCAIMVKHGILEESHNDGWRFTPQGRKGWRLLNQ